MGPGASRKPWELPENKPGTATSRAGTGALPSPSGTEICVPGPAFKAKPGRQVAGKRGLGCSGAAVAREEALGAGPEEAAGQ